MRPPLPSLVLVFLIAVAGVIIGCGIDRLPTAASPDKLTASRGGQLGPPNMCEDVALRCNERVARLEAVLERVRAQVGDDSPAVEALVDEVEQARKDCSEAICKACPGSC